MDVKKMATALLDDLLPDRSKPRYEKASKEFQEWMASENISEITEEVILVYLSEKSKTIAPTGLQSLFCMLKATHRHIKFGSFLDVKAFLKKKAVGYRPKKSKIFGIDQCTTFIREADDKCHLLYKVIVILGIAGAMRKIEIFKLQFLDVNDKAEYIEVNVKDTKTNVDRRFVVVNDATVNFADILRAYMQMRPPQRTDTRFLVAYRNGKCTNLPVGINTIGGTPTKMATFLKLPNPEMYTGHSFRRSSATLLANSGANLLQIKKHGGWKSSTVAESYVDDSNHAKMEAANRILAGTSGATSTVKANTELTLNHSTMLAPTTTGILFPNVVGSANNCNFTINIINNNK